jgi:2-desacetyl-2-hydroxyethyl bacteriochlorophyllide A dehydrogenase
MRRRALWFVAPYRVEVCDEELPPPDPDGLLVRTLVSAISPGTELLIYRGQAPADLPADETIAALGGGLAFPLRYGYAAVGVVEATGAAVDPAWQGRTIFAFQPHVSHFLIAPDAVVPVTESPEEAALLPNLETAVNLLLDGRPLIGERVVVFGQGVVGLLTTALLARLPLSGLVTLDPLPSRRRRSLALGATASLDPGLPDLVGRVGGAFGLPTAGPAADLCFELSGAPVALDGAIAVTGYSGRVVIGSWYGEKRVDLHLGGAFHRSKIHLIASQVSRIAPELSGRWTARRRLHLARDLLRTVRPAGLISHRFPLDDAPAAYNLLHTRPDEALQVMLTY